MTQTGSRALLVVSAGLVVGAGWFAWEKAGLEREIVAARAEGLARFDARRADGAVTARNDSPVSTAPSREEPASAGALAIHQANEAAKMKDLSDLMQGGMMGTALHWVSLKNDFVDMVDSFADSFAGDPQTATLIKAAVEKARKTVYEQVAATTTMTQTSDDEVVLKVGGSPEALAAVANMHQAIVDALGPERGVLYDKFGLKSAIDNMMGNFGTHASTVTVSRTFDANRQAYVYSTQRQDPSGGGGWSSGVPRGSVESSIGALAPLLPGGFLR